MRPSRIWLIAGLAVATARPAAGEQWLQLRSQHLNIISSATEPDIRAMASQLEGFHEAFSRRFGNLTHTNQPTTLIVFSGRQGYEKILPWYLGAYFRDGWMEPLIVASADDWKRKPRVIQHEYTHALTRELSHTWPLWMVEGVAEVYASFEVQSNRAVTGTVPRFYISELHTGWMPLRQVLTIETERHEYATPTLFYGQSWALTHYLMFNSEESSRKFGRYDRLLREGRDPLQTLQDLYQTDLKILDHDLRRYIDQKTFPVLVEQFEHSDNSREVSVQPIRNADVQCYLAVLLTLGGLASDAEPYLQRAKAGGA